MGFGLSGKRGKDMEQKVYALRDVTNLKEMVESSCDLFSENIAFLWRDRKNGQIIEKKYREAGEDIRALATALNARGFENEKIGITGPNGYDWAISYLAAGAGVGLIMPVDKDFNAEQLSFVYQHSEAEVLLYHDSLEKVVEESGVTCEKIPFSAYPALIEEGKNLRAAGDASYENHVINPTTFGILLYTSGTMGVAKGVMLSQHNVCGNVRQALQGVHFGPEDRGLSMLPLHHTYECTAGFLGFFFSGSSIAYLTSLRHIMTDLKEFAPTVLVTVPQVLESFYKNILKKYDEIPGGKAIYAVQKTVAGALTTGGRQKIFGAVKKVFGGRLRLFLVGAAPVPPAVYKAFWRFGFAVYIGYGLTETSPISVMHSDFYHAPDDVGYPATGVQARILDPDEDGVGELCVKGPNVMLGYYKDPEETARVLKKGWFRTGDLAQKTAKGTYRITGRIKSMIVADNGKKIFPEELEDAVRKSPYVKECMVYTKPGKRAGHVIVGIFPDRERLDEEYRAETKGAFDSMPPDRVREIFLKVISDVNSRFPGYKRIRGLALRDAPFEKTTTQKIRRNDPRNLIDSQTDTN